MEETITHRPTIKSWETSTQLRNNTHTHTGTISSRTYTRVYTRSRIDLAEKWIQTSRLWGLLRSLPLPGRAAQTEKNQCRRRKGEEYKKESIDFTVPLARISGILAEIFPNKICSRQLSTLPKAPINFFISDLRLHSWKEPRFLRSLDARWRGGRKTSPNPSVGLRRRRSIIYYSRNTYYQQFKKVSNNLQISSFEKEKVREKDFYLND